MRKATLQIWSDNALHRNPVKQTKEKMERWKGIDRMELIPWCHQSIYCETLRVSGPGDNPVQFVAEDLRVVSPT